MSGWTKAELDRGYIRFVCGGFRREGSVRMVRATTATEVGLACANPTCTLIGSERTFYPDLHPTNFVTDQGRRGELPIFLYNPECPECEADGIEVLEARGNDKGRPT